MRFLRPLLAPWCLLVHRDIRKATVAYRRPDGSFRFAHVRYCHACAVGPGTVQPLLSFHRIPT